MTYTQYQTTHTEQDRLTKLAKDCLHSCGGNLTVAWDGESDRNRLRCGKCRVFVPETEVVKQRSLTERWRADETLPLIIENRLENKYGREVMPIKGLSETLRLPRLGKIHLGVKKVSQKGVEYPTATDYFVFGEDAAQDAKRICGTDKPNKLDVIIPVEDEAIFASQFYRAYSQTRGCICRGDGDTASQVQDMATHQIVSSPAAKTERVQIVCPGKECPIYQAKKCSEVMCLQFMLPDMPGLGVWQIDTGSINSILNINSDVAMVRSVIGHVAMVPLTLSLEPQEIISPEDGKKKKVMCLHLRASGSLGQLLQAAKAPLARFMLPAPETGHIDGEVISLDEDGNPDIDMPEDNAPVTKQNDKDPLIAWTGTSRPQQASAVPQKTGIGPNSGPDIQPETATTTVATATPTESAKVAPTQTGNRVVKMQLDALDKLVGGRNKLHEVAQKECQCAADQMTRDQAAKLISKLQKEAK